MFVMLVRSEMSLVGSRDLIMILRKGMFTGRNVYRTSFHGGWTGLVIVMVFFGSWIACLSLYVAPSREFGAGLLL